MFTFIKNLFAPSVLTIEQAQQKGLVFKCNIYGDAINHLNCRSIWTDENGKEYKVSSLFLENNQK